MFAKKPTRIAIFGGRFDPIHAGHIAILKQLVDSAQFDRIHVIPTASPPHKPVEAPLSDRIEMIHAALSHANFDTSRCIVDDRESRRYAPSWTIDTIRDIHADYPDATLTLVVGSDTAIQLHTWKSAAQLLNSVELFIVVRPGTSADEVDAYFKSRFDVKPHYAIYSDAPHADSSSDVRRQKHIALSSITPIIEQKTLYPVKKRRVLGITGRVGSGKSTAAEFLSAEFNLSVIDLDTIGHTLLTKDAIKNELTNAFGKSIIENDAVSRAILREIVFTNPRQLRVLNSIMHPEIRQCVISTMSRLNGDVIIVGALFEEIGLISVCDAIWVIDSEDAAIIDHIGNKFNIRHAQMSRADYLGLGTKITNTFDDAFMSHLRSEFLKFRAPFI